ncbi:flagellar brake protein [Roseateles microcysteis]|uniref:flagellar brake protein n=1 Tax=Roseateles microcysteis TaxID=3119057 RepID=UPI002FE559C3
MPDANPSSEAGVDTVDVGSFRLDATLEIQTLLRELQAQRTPLTLSTPTGETCKAMLVEVDARRGVIDLDSSASPEHLRTLLASDEVQAQAFLDNIRLQFDVDGLVLVQGSAGAMLQANLPSPLFRFQRRQAYRVQPTGSAYPFAKFEHPDPAIGLLRLRVLDVSIGGLALLLPPELPPLEPGALIELARLELDRDTRLETSLRLQHVSSLQNPAEFVQLGCAFVQLPPLSLRDLQRFIDQTQKRRRLLQRKI